jgi:hypothetical protein
MAEKTDIVPIKPIETLILTIRGQKVMLDADLATLYGVPTRVLNQSVKRNLDRFPKDFMFQLNKEEKDEVITNCDHLAQLKFSPSMPYAFTEHGALMVANVLKSDQAIEMSVFVVRAFIKLREILSTHKTLARKLEKLEGRLDSHDEDIQTIMAAIKSLMLPPKGSSGQGIGFKAGKSGKNK